MNNKECEEQLKRLIYDWETEGLLTKINATDIEAIKHLMLENQRLKQMVNFGGITVVNCPNCKEEIIVNFCRETEHYRRKYENAVADYEYEHYKNQKAIKYINEWNIVPCGAVGKRQAILDILKGEKDNSLHEKSH